MATLTHVGSGKVREIYQIDAEHLLLVASDRISAYDCVLAPEIPDKGRVLTGISSFFFDLVDVPNHRVSLDVSDVSDDPWMVGRSTIVRRAEMLPIECVVRGYLYGSAWREYRNGGGPATEHLPAGLQQASRLSAPIFTPATKSDTGHDVNLTEAEARALVGDDRYEELRRTSLHVYEKLAEHTRGRGAIIADTKLEFGTIDGDLVLADELGTPDSSRYWPAEPEPGSGPVPSLDKQFVRDWLDSTGWDHVPPPPALPEEVVWGTRQRYLDAFRLVTQTDFDTYLEDPDRWTNP